jgi:hypothetical protein
MKYTIIKAMIIRGFSEKEIFEILWGKSDDNLEQYLKDNNIVQIYNNKIGIRNISYPISIDFWSMLQNIKGEVLLFKQEIKNINKGYVFNDLMKEFDIDNINDISSMEINRRTNQMILQLKDKTMKVSNLYGGIEYNGKSYWFENKDMITGYIGKDEQDNVYIKINEIKYLIVE